MAPFSPRMRRRAVLARTLLVALVAAGLSWALAPVALAAPGLATAAASAPDSPSIEGAGAFSPSLGLVEWSAGASPGSAPLEGYRVQLRPAGGSFADVATTSGQSAVLFALDPETTYDVRVLAFNSVGASTPSTVESFATPALDDADLPPVTDLVADAGDGSVTLGWTPVSTGGPYVAHVIAYRPAGGTWVQSFGTSDDDGATITGLANGTLYEFMVAPMAFLGGRYVYGTAAQTSATPSESLPEDPVDGGEELPGDPSGDEGPGQEAPPQEQPGGEEQAPEQPGQEEPSGDGAPANEADGAVESAGGQRDAGQSRAELAETGAETTLVAVAGGFLALGFVAFALRRATRLGPDA